MIPNAFSLLQQPFAGCCELMRVTTEMWTAAAQVIGHRTGRMAASGPVPSARDRNEFTLMVQEKVDAAGQSAAAMGREWVSVGSLAAVQAWGDLLRTGQAALALATSGTIQQSVERQAELARTLQKSAASASGLSNAGVRIARRGLKPIHAAATANARRLGRL